jgi:ketosteroid isomerase-like protein
MENEKNINTVKQLYADVVARNLQGVLNILTDDIRWEPPFVPELHHTKLQKGKDGVTNWVIEMANEVTYSQVIPQGIYADGDAVIVKGHFEGTANSTGKSFQSDWVHLWIFRGDKICSYQAFWNTHNVVNAFK